MLREVLPVRLGRCGLGGAGAQRGKGKKNEGMHFVLRSAWPPARLLQAT